MGTARSVNSNPRALYTKIKKNNKEAGNSIYAKNFDAIHSYRNPMVPFARVVAESKRTLYTRVQIDQTVETWRTAG